LARLLSTLLVLGLLGGTAAAFAVTEGLKLEKSPITGTRVTKVFSPTCRCATDKASVDFKLRSADTITVTILGRSGKKLGNIAESRHMPRGPVSLTWDGRNEFGTLVPDGAYRVRVHLADRHQTINLPNTIRVDTQAPVLTAGRVRPRVISPDHDGRAEYVNLPFRVSKPARPLLYVDARQTGRGRVVSDAGTVHWFGKLRGKALRPGLYRLWLRAEDQVGNVSRPSRPVTVRIRFITLHPGVVHVRAGRRFSVGVGSDAKRIRWLLHGRTGKGRPGILRVRAPKRPGSYTLYVTAVTHTATAQVVVGR
jgi:FlgD Ig-like domain